MHAGHGNGPAAEDMTRLPRHSLHTGDGEEAPEGRGQDEAGQGVEEDEEVCVSPSEVSTSFDSVDRFSLASEEQRSDLLSLPFCRKKRN